MAFIRLKPWSERSGRTFRRGDRRRACSAPASSMRDADVFVSQPPTMRGLGNSSGFDVELKDLGGLGHDALAAHATASSSWPRRIRC